MKFKKGDLVVYETKHISKFWIMYDHGIMPGNTYVVESVSDMHLFITVEGIENTYNINNFVSLSEYRNKTIESILI